MADHRRKSRDDLNLFIEEIRGYERATITHYPHWFERLCWVIGLEMVISQACQQSSRGQLLFWQFTVQRRQPAVYIKTLYADDAFKQLVNTDGFEVVLSHDLVDARHWNPLFLSRNLFFF
jgi:hypothetical protein